MRLRKSCKVTNAVISPRHQISDGGYRPETQVDTWKCVQSGFPNPNLKTMGRKAISLHVCSSSIHLLLCSLYPLPEFTFPSVTNDS